MKNIAEVKEKTWVYVKLEEKTQDISHMINTCRSSIENNPSASNGMGRWQ